MAKRKTKAPEQPTATFDGDDGNGAVRPEGDAEPTASASAELQRADRHESIAIAAYYRALARGFLEGHELDDWLAAEREYMEAFDRARPDWPAASAGGMADGRRRRGAAGPGPHSGRSA